MYCTGPLYGGTWLRVGIEWPRGTHSDHQLVRDVMARKLSPGKHPSLKTGLPETVVTRWWDDANL